MALKSEIRWSILLCLANGRDVFEQSKVYTTIALLPVEADGRPRYRSNHYQVNLTVLEALSRQTIPGHFFDPVPILAEIARSLLLGLEFRLQATSLALISVRNLKKDRLPSLFHLGLARQAIAHRLFLYDLERPSYWDLPTATPFLRPYCVAREIMGLTWGQNGPSAFANPIATGT
jgi:hypothetical protein